MQIANINGLERVLCDHDDRLIAKTILYCGLDSSLPGNIHRLYADPNCTIECTLQQVVDAYLKGLVVYDFDSYSEGLAVTTPISVVVREYEQGAIVMLSDANSEGGIKRCIVGEGESL